MRKKNATIRRIEEDPAALLLLSGALFLTGVIIWLIGIFLNQPDGGAFLRSTFG